MYSLMESSQDTDQFLTTIHRYVQVGIYVKGYFSKKLNRFQREIIEVCEFFVDEDNKPRTNLIYKKSMDGTFVLKNPTKRLLDYMSIQNVFLPDDVFNLGTSGEEHGDSSTDTHTHSEALRDTMDVVNNDTSSSSVIPSSTVNTEVKKDVVNTSMPQSNNTQNAQSTMYGNNTNTNINNNQSNTVVEDEILRPNLNSEEEVL